MKKVHIDKVPEVIGPYSQATSANGFVFCAGQIGLDPKTNTLVDGIENQTRQVMNNLESVLKHAGSSFDNIVKTTIFLKNISDYKKVNEIYDQYFKKIKPARATVEVSRLNKDALIEVEAIASV